MCEIAIGSNTSKPNLEEYHDKFKEIRNEGVYAIRESKINIEKKKNVIFD